MCDVKIAACDNIMLSFTVGKLLGRRRKSANLKCRNWYTLSFNANCMQIRPFFAAQKGFRNLCRLTQRSKRRAASLQTSLFVTRPPIFRR